MTAVENVSKTLAAGYAMLTRENTPEAWTRAMTHAVVHTRELMDGIYPLLRQPPSAQRETAVLHAAQRAGLETFEDMIAQGRVTEGSMGVVMKFHTAQSPVLEGRDIRWHSPPIPPLVESMLVRITRIYPGDTSERISRIDSAFVGMDRLYLGDPRVSEDGAMVPATVFFHPRAYCAVRESFR